MTVDRFAGDPRTNRERMLARDFSIADDPENGRLHRRGVRLAEAYHSADVAGDPITIGEDCRIGPNVQLLTPTHPMDPQSRRDKLEAAEPITIEDNVWLGGGVIVCPGVTTGKNSVIGAGSVVPKDIPANVVAVGNRAGVIRTIG